MVHYLSLLYKDLALRAARIISAFGYIDNTNRNLFKTTEVSMRIFRDIKDMFPDITLEQKPHRT